MPTFLLGVLETTRTSLPCIPEGAGSKDFWDRTQEHGTFPAFLLLPQMLSGALLAWLLSQLTLPTAFPFLCVLLPTPCPCPGQLVSLVLWGHSLEEADLSTAQVMLGSLEQAALARMCTLRGALLEWGALDWTWGPQPAVLWVGGFQTGKATV